MKKVAAWAVVFALLAANPAWSQVTVGSEGANNTVGGSATRILLWNETTEKIARGDDQGNLFQRPDMIWDEELNLRSNSPINDQYVSGVIDARKWGAGLKTLLIKASGNRVLYVAVDAMYSSVEDSNSTFRFPLGGTNPFGTTVNGGVVGSFRVVAGAAINDSTLAARTSYAIPLADSISGIPLVAPFFRVHIWTTASAQIWAHVVGRPL